MLIPAVEDFTIKARFITFFGLFVENIFFF